MSSCRVAGACGSQHTDEDNNGRCDACYVSVVIMLDLFAINDLHGKFCDTEEQVGVDEMTTYLKRAYREEDHVLVLSSGDMWQGSSESNLTKGQIVTEWMNEMDVVSMTLGNHEYDWGEEYILQNAALAEFPFLAINIYDADTHARASYCQPSVMVQRGGADIGIIGAIGDCYSSISKEMAEGVYFKTGRELTELVKAEAQRLREAGADFIIYSLHGGYDRSSKTESDVSDAQLRSYYDTVLSDGYVDIVFEGHSHKSYILKDSEGVYHLQGGGDNRGLCHAEAEINFANGQSKVRTAEFVSSSVYERLGDDPIVEELLEKYEEQVSVGTRVLGRNGLKRSSRALCRLVADLYCQAGIAAFGEDYDIVLGGGYLSARSPYELAAGQVTYAQLQMLFPFDNDLVLCSIKGSDLKNRFIDSTNDKYYVSYSEYGDTVMDHVDPDAIYYVIVDSYTSTYAPNRLTEVARYTPGIYARDLLAAYVEAGGLQ
jgi:2',3'-cyclic-nucleotide 2'-phosphodiesterase (5'-nucleotidase family)